MREQGTVVSILSEYATVIFDRSASCESCRACMDGEDGKKMMATVKNTANAGIGDTVEIELRSSTMLKAAWLAYGFPLAMLIIGAIAAELIRPIAGYTEAISAVISCACALASYLVLRMLEPHFGKKGGFTPVMRGIINSHKDSIAKEDDHIV